MSHLRITLLGPPEVFHFEQHLLFPDRKALALLAYLATEGGMHERQRLARLLWPESDAAHGRTALRITLHHLRQTLQESTQPEHETHLLITQKMLGLNQDSDIELDLHSLQTAGSIVQDQTALEAGQGKIRRPMIARLQHAASLYHGNFLQEFSLRDTIDFDNWVGIQSGYWYQRIEQVFDWLSQLQRAEGEIEQAIATVEHWRSFDPLNEDISLRLMQLHFALGNRVEGLKVYQSYQEVLRKELQAKPSQRMIAQAELMRTATSPRSHPTREQISTPPASVGSLLEIPFVGRGVEISHLMSLYERASRGQPQVVVIEGEAGIGKSRLASTFLSWARAQGAGILAGRAFKSYQHLAYQPLLDPLRASLEQEQDLHQLLSDIWLGELSRLLPELREHYPDLPPSTSDEVFDASRFFEALARLGQAYAARAPLLIFIDDLQWTDQSTLDLLQYLVRQWTEHAIPVMLLFNRRVETRSLDPWLVEWFTHLKRDVSLTRLELEPLAVQDILQIVQAVAGKNGKAQTGQSEHSSLRLPSPSLQITASGASPERFGAWLYAETKGQPFYVRATLETLLERGELVPRRVEGKGWVFEPQAVILHPDAQSSTLPSDVRTMIQLRLAQLSPSARELLVAGAVLDHGFSFVALCQVAHLTTQDGLFALDEAIERLLLQETHHQNGTMKAVSYMFAHDKIREVVYAEAVDARRRIFHERALEVLAQSGASAAELAYHALASGNVELAFRWSMAAGDEAMTVFATRDASGHYEQARQLADEHKLTVPVATLHHLFSQLGRAYEIRNDAKAAQATYQTMLETARRLHATEMECTALNRQAVLVGEDIIQLERVLGLLQEALKVAERNGDQASLAETYWSLARVTYYALKLDESLSYGRQAYTLARTHGKPDLVVRVLNILSYTTKALGQWEESASLAEEAWQLAAQQGNRIMEADCLARVADARINFGQPHEGVTAAQAAYAISLEIEHTWSQVLSGYTLARGLLEVGSYEEALTTALQSTAAAHTLTFSILLVVSQLTLGLVYQALQFPEKALQINLESLAIAESVSAKRYVAMSASLLCADAVFAQDWESASRYVRQAVATRDPHEVIFAETPRWTETAALVHAGDSELATKELQSFNDFFSTSRRCRIVSARAQAVLAQARGDSEQALAYLHEAIAEAKAIGLPGECWQAEAVLGRLHLTRAEDEQAQQAFTAAAATIKQLANNITSAEIRTHFLTAPQVHFILTHAQD